MTDLQRKRSELHRRMDAAIEESKRGQRERSLLLQALERRRGDADNAGYVDAGDVLFMANGKRVARPNTNGNLRGVGDTGLDQGGEGDAV